MSTGARRVLATLALSCLVSIPLFAGFGSRELILPAIGRVDGSGGSHFYTTVWVTNASAETANVEIQFLVAGQANVPPVAPPVNVSLAPGQTKVFENIAESLFGIKGLLGAARFRSNADVVVSARVYNLPDGATPAASDGEFFAAVPPDFGIAKGDSALLQGLRISPDFRYNLIFVETTGNATAGHLRVVDENGVQLANAPVSLLPFEERLVSLASYLPAGTVLADGALTLTIDDGNGRVLVAGSLLANQSQNAAGFEMAFRPGLLAANAGGSISGITAGSGLTGGGTSGSVALGIAPGGVVASMIAGGTVVRSINGLKDDVTIVGGQNVTVSQAGSTITINAAATPQPQNVTLAGDVNGPTSATVVTRVGGATATNVAAATTAANAATNANTPDTIVKRDASGNFSAGVITATLNGNATSATTAGSATNFSGSLSGDVTGTQSSTVVSSVGGQTAANVATATAAANNATNANTASTLVKRDASGNFYAGTITATLNGTATSAASTTNFSGSLSGDVTGTQSATVVSTVGGQTAANVASATTAANSATNANTASTIVKRDASGNFSAGTITATLNGNATSTTNFSGSLAGDVTGAQSSTVVGTVGGQTAANVAAATTAANAATNLNTASTIVRRDASGNFSAGTITGTVVNATSQFDLSGVPFLWNGGSTTYENTLLGIDAGASLVPGANLIGYYNTFVGASAGKLNVGGRMNTLVGTEAAAKDTSGESNTVVGAFAAWKTDGATANVMIGSNAGFNTTDGSNNVFVGYRAGFAGTGSFAERNVYVGREAGSNTTGHDNAYFGSGTGASDNTGHHNTLLGASANTGASGLQYATAVGADTTVYASNTVVLGRNIDTVSVPGNLTVSGTISGSLAVAPSSISGYGSAGNFLRSTGSAWAASTIQSSDLPAGSASYIQNTSSQQASSNFNVSGNGTAGGTLSGNIVNSTTKYQINGSTFVYDSGDASAKNTFLGKNAGASTVPVTATASGVENTFLGNAAGQTNADGFGNTAVGNRAGTALTSGALNTLLGGLAGSAGTTMLGNTYIGYNAGISDTTGSSNTALGVGADVTAGLNNATAIGAGSKVTTSNTTVLGRSNGADTVQIPGALQVTGTIGSTSSSAAITIGTTTNTVKIPGSLVVTGSISKGSGSFRIDHPLDPENKYLYHSFVESPDMMNVYNGNVVTDGNGVAVVELPPYFESLNRDFRYQLTPIGRFAQAIVAEEIANNRFVVRTDKPNVKVSWQVTGVRKDAYAEAHRIVPEIEKPADERGHCQNEEACARQPR